MRDIWIVAQMGEGVTPAFYELLSELSKVYAGVRDDCAFVAVTIGGSDATKAELAGSGVDKVLSIEHEKLAPFHPDYAARALAEAVRAGEPYALVVPATSWGGELAPAVAAKLDVGLVAHCAKFELDADGVLHMLVPAFGGKLMADNTIPRTRPLMVSVRPGVFSRDVREAQGTAELEVFAPGSLDGYESGVSIVSASPVERGAQSIEDAQIVVCAGLGVAQSGSYEKAKELAGALGAGFAYTRPVSDLGFAPDESAMVGASGKTVKPALYLGFGNSGAGQHVCGIKDSKVIVNVNSDEQAACFDVSDYKVVADCGAILDELLALVKK